MNGRFHLAVLALGLGFSMLSAPGCSQGVGERCERNEDCEASLTCVGFESAPSPDIGGTCQVPGSTTTDGSVQFDGATDASPFDGQPADASPDVPESIGDGAANDATDATATDASDDSLPSG